MPDIFGSTSTPRWMGPDEEQMKWAQIGNPAYTQAYNQANRQRFASDEADKSRRFQANEYEKNRLSHEQINRENRASQEARTGLMIKANQAKANQVKYQDFEDQTLFIHSVDEINRAVKNSNKDHLLSLQQPPFNLAKTGQAWQGLITKGLKDIEASTLGKNVDRLNMVEHGRYLDIVNNGVLSNEAKAVQLDRLFKSSNERLQLEKPNKTNLTAAEKNLAAAKLSGAVKTPEDEIQYWKTVFQGKTPFDSVTETADVTPGKPATPAETGWFGASAQPVTPPVTNSVSVRTTRHVRPDGKQSNQNPVEQPKIRKYNPATGKLE